MPFVFAIVGLVLIISGARGRSSDLLSLVEGDLTEGNFVYWMLSIAVLGALGYIDALRPLSRALLVLVIVVLVLAEDKAGGAGGFFAKFQESVSEITGREAA
jgi:hypothetical protein